MKNAAARMKSRTLLLVLATLAGAAVALLDFDWHFLMARPHDLNLDLLLVPPVVLFVIVSLLAGAGSWLGSRISSGVENAETRGSWETSWVAFVLLWVILFNLSASRLKVEEPAALLSLLLVTVLATFGSFVVTRFTATKIALRGAGGESTEEHLADRLLLLDVLLVLSVPFLLAETVLVKGLLSAGSLLAMILFAAACLAVLILYLRKRSLFRRLALALTLLFAVTLIVLGVRSSRSSEVATSVADGHPGPPVILITIDTLRANVLGTYGSAKGLTPNLDRFADKAVVFERTYASSPWTLPSMATIMTGVSPLVHRATDVNGSLPRQLPTLAERLQERGFLTLAVGRNPYIKGSRGFGRGFEWYRYFPRTCLRESLAVQLLQLLLPSSLVIDASTTDLVRIASSLAENHASSSFFLWLHIFDPHIPYAPPEEYLPPVASIEELGTEFSEHHQIRSGELVPSPKEREWIRALYEGEVRYVDHEVGKFLSTLQRLGMFDDSLIIITSDHGEEFWEHDGFEHGHALYNEVVRVPLLIKPSATRSADSGGLRVSEPVSIASILRTTLVEAGVGRMDGGHFGNPALSAHWKSKATSGRAQPIVIGSPLYPTPKLSLVEGPFKYIRNLEDGKEQLYHLIEDPDETNDLIASKAGVARLLASLLDREVARERELAESLDIEESTRPRRIDKQTEQELRALGYIE